MKRTQLYLRYFAVFAIITIVIFSFITSNIISLGQYYDRNTSHGVFLNRETYDFVGPVPDVLLKTSYLSEKDIEEYKLINIETQSQIITVFLKLAYSTHKNVKTNKKNISSPVIVRIHGPTLQNADDSNETPIIVDVQILNDNFKTTVFTQTNVMEINEKFTDNTSKVHLTNSTTMSTENRLAQNNTYTQETHVATLKFTSPTIGQNHIIFIESSCVIRPTSTNETELDKFNKTEPVLHLKTRQVCAIESAARANPDVFVYLLYTCPLDGGSLARSSELVQQVFNYSNVFVWHQTMSSFFEETPLDELYKSGRMNETKYPVEHSSDVLRLLALWKYGGTYLDTDFIVRRSFTGLGTNFAVAENPDFLANGVMSFSSHGVGKTIISAFVNEVLTNFRGDIYNYNGPALITRVLKKFFCNTTTNLMTSVDCQGFRVLPRSTFFPVLHKNYPAFFDEANSTATMAAIQDSYAVHLWGHDIKGKTHIGSRQPFVLLEQEFCPISYSFTPDQSESK